VGEQMASKENVLIAIVAAAGETGLDRAQLQKSVFLVGKEFDRELPSDFYQFQPYLYGPFAQGVYADIERLSDGPMIETFPGDDGRPFYRLAENNTDLHYSLSNTLESGVKNIVGWVSRMSSFYELVRAIYFLYPEQRENSVLQYSEKLAQEESLVRSFRDIAAGRTRSVDKLIAELPEQD